jgi:predicted metal-dependent HD superfamily phosphohydrolase
MIKQAYLSKVVQCGLHSSTAEELWLEIEMAYTDAGRHFHDLAHLEHLLKELQSIQPLINDWDTLLFSMVYHDVVYDVEQNAVMNDNEERSAAFAERHLQQIGYPPEKIDKCRQQILDTQKHTASHDHDTNLLTDADLSILGQPWNIYDTYRNNIRKEFGVYPDAIYNAGRRKVLHYFLKMEPLYKTGHFHSLYEAAAKENIRKELQLLQG